MPIVASIVCGALVIGLTWVARSIVREREIFHAKAVSPLAISILYANAGLLVVFCVLVPEYALFLVVVWILGLIVWVSACELVLRNSDKTQEKQFNEDDPEWLDVAKNIKPSGEE